MKKLLDWFINKLGGYTSSDYKYIQHQYEDMKNNRKYYIDENKVLQAKYNEVKETHNKMIDWFHGINPIMVRLEGKEYSAITITTPLDERVPVEYVKHELCRNLSNKLFEDKLISFDIEDDRMNGGKMYRGMISVLLPVGFGNR